MRNGVMVRCDVDLKDFFKMIQKERLKSGKDKKKKSLTLMSRLAFSILNKEKNKTMMLTNRIPTQSKNIYTKEICL